MYRATLSVRSHAIYACIYHVHCMQFRITMEMTYIFILIEDET